jgi:hypothetical protein
MHTQQQKTVGRGDFCVVRAKANSYFAVKGKQAISSSQNFLL